MANNSSTQTRQVNIQNISLLMNDTNIMLNLFGVILYLIRQFTAFDKTVGTTDLTPATPPSFYEQYGVLIRNRLSDLIALSGDFSGSFFPLSGSKFPGVATPIAFVNTSNDFINSPTSDLFVDQDFSNFVNTSIDAITTAKKNLIAQLTQSSKTNVKTKSESDAIINIAVNSPFAANVNLATTEATITDDLAALGIEVNNARKIFYRSLAQGTDVVGLSLAEFLKVSNLEVAIRSPWDQQFEAFKLKAVNELFGGLGKFCSTATQNKFQNQ